MGQVKRDEYEEAFIARINKLTASGLDFRVMAERALPEIMGESPSAVLLSWAGDESLEDPEKFVTAVSRIFGPSAASIYAAIARIAESEARKPDTPEQSPESLLADVISATGLGSEAEARGETNYLHSHRIKDKWDELLEAEKESGLDTGQ